MEAAAAELLERPIAAHTRSWCTPSRIAALSELWSCAYADYTTWRTLVAGTSVQRQTLLRPYYAHYACSLAVKPGFRAYAHTIGDLVACSIMSQEVGCCCAPSLRGRCREALAGGLETMMLALRLGVVTALRIRQYSRGGKRLQRRFAAARAALFESEKLWRIDMVAVAPRLRRRGLMKQMFAALLRDADVCHADVILSTSSRQNLEAYQKLGFAVVEASRLCGAASALCSDTVLVGPRERPDAGALLQTTLMVRMHPARDPVARWEALNAALSATRAGANTHQRCNWVGWKIACAGLLFSALLLVTS